MSRKKQADDAFDVPDLPTLIQDKLDRGATLQSLQAASGDVVKYQRWGQLAKGKRLLNFPEPATISAIAKALGITETAAVIATAKSLGMDVSRRGSYFGQRLPASADQLPEPVQNSLIALIESIAGTERGRRRRGLRPDGLIEFPGRSETSLDHEPVVDDVETAAYNSPEPPGKSDQ